MSHRPRTGGRWAQKQRELDDKPPRPPQVLGPRWHKLSAEEKAERVKQQLEKLEKDAKF